jgi:hypothetical protein
VQRGKPGANFMSPFRSKFTGKNWIGSNFCFLSLNCLQIPWTLNIVSQQSEKITSVFLFKILGNNSGRNDDS